MRGAAGEPPIGLRAPEALRDLVAVTTLLSTERDLHRLLGKLVESARRLTCAEAGRVYLLDSTKRVLVPEVCQNERVDVPLGYLAQVPLFRAEGKRNEDNLVAFCAFSGEPVNVLDAYRYSGFDCEDLYRYDRMTGYRTRSVLAVPLRNHRDQTIGVLQLVNRRREGELSAFDADQEAMVIAFAAQAAVAVDNVQLIEQNRRLITLLDRDNRELEQENRRLRERMKGLPRFGDIIGESTAMRRVFELVDKVRASDATVLLRGETGTGKELIAAAVHRSSRRADRPFVVQNCAAVPEGLLESELFGYKKGAFTGAGADKKGLIEAADGGTLFLDEIGDMPIALQAKLLRVLQEREVRPLGEVQGRHVNIRVIAATHCDLETKIKDGEFREDLFYRLSVFPITIPPLRERQDDVPALLQYFSSRFAESYGKRIRGFAPVALDLLGQYAYPGNIRELKNIVERAVLLAEEGGWILPEHLPAAVTGPRAADQPPDEESGLPLKERVARYEARVIEEALAANDWNQTRTSEVLSVPRRTLIEKINKHAIQRPEAEMLDE
jgi:sigma-54-dependent transcriptional regulator